MKKKLILAANDAPGAILANAAEGGSPFAILQHNRFVIPYGDFPHKVGLQKFDRTAAEEIVANHNGLLNKLVTWARGEKASYPVYVGHPDLPGSKDTDKRAYGWIENLHAENDGLHLDVKWSDAGRELVENAHFKFYSPLWWTKPVRGGVRPVGLKSMGLTNDPNIPVPALANEADGESEESQDEETETETTTPDSMKDILTALGLAEDATAEDAIAAIGAMKTAAENADTYKAAKEKAEEEKTEAENTKATIEGELATARTELQTATERTTTLEASLEVAANAAIDAAIASGRITLAEREEKVTELLAANDFAEALQELGKLPAKVKTESTTGDLGSAKTKLVVAHNDASAAARAERAQLVENELQNTNPNLSLGERKRIAWGRASAKHPEVFGKTQKESSEADA
jgi:hypothetical protein